MFVETSLPNQGQSYVLINPSRHYCQIALIIPVQNPERSMRLITNMRLLNRVYGIHGIQCIGNLLGADLAVTVRGQ